MSISSWGSPSFLLACVLHALPGAEPPPLWPDNPWSAASAAAAYAEASAHDPRYGDAALWPRLGGQEPFLREVWPAGRILVWAKPGQSGSAGAKATARKHLAADDPANWLEVGKPATRLFDEQTDVVFPASETPYQVNLVGLKEQVFRHLTIGSGAHYHGGGDAIGRRHLGHTWIKRGGKMSCGGPCTFLGDRHQWYRNDNQAADNPKDAYSVNNTAQYFFFRKEGAGSVEFLGLHSCTDEFKVYGSLAVVGRDSCVRPGRNASPFVEAGGTLALMDGATWGPWANSWGSPCLRLSDATLCGGLPDRPLTTGATVTISFKNADAAQYQGENPPTEAGKPTVFPRVAGLFLEGRSRVQVHRVAGGQGRLLITWAGETPCNAVGLTAKGSPARAALLKKQPERGAFLHWHDARPRGIDVLLTGGAAIGPGVVLDHLRPGGVVLGPGADQTRVEASFGPDCAARDAALFSTAATVKKGGGY